MTRSLQELSDRLEIQDLLVAYADAIDRQDFDALDDVFTPDALVDCTQLGSVRGDRDAFKQAVRDAMPRFVSYQHMVATSRVTLHGDTGTGRSIFFNPLVVRGPDGAEHTYACGGWYADRYVRTPDGWRIAERVEERSWVWDRPPDDVMRALLGRDA